MISTETLTFYGVKKKEKGVRGGIFGYEMHVGGGGSIYKSCLDLVFMSI